jgi:hypothetical protein
MPFMLKKKTLILSLTHPHAPMHLATTRIDLYFFPYWFDPKDTCLHSLYSCLLGARHRGMVMRRRGYYIIIIIIYRFREEK